jgi:hypothetical protein
VTERNIPPKIGFIGNCQAELLHRAFQQVIPLSQFQTFYHFFDVPEASLASARADLATCTLLLMQDIQDLEHYPLREAIGVDTKIIGFPFLRFAAPWPYDDFNGLRDNGARAQDDPALHTVTYYDGVLGRLRKQVPEVEARFDTYAALDVKGLIDPVRVLDFETRRLEALDARFGCAIGGFILNEFRKQQLFYTVNRPCGALLKMVFDFILERLGTDLVLSAPPDLDELRSIQVPVHPKVAQCLSIEWADAGRLYEVNGDSLNFETYVRRYIERYG